MRQNIQKPATTNQNGPNNPKQATTIHKETQKDPKRLKTRQNNTKRPKTSQKKSQNYPKGLLN